MLHLRNLDKNTPVPLYFQLKSLLLDEIKSGEYAVDSMLPTEKEFSEMFQISRTTVRQAITELVQEGWVYRIKSKGTFVARVKINQDFIKHLETFDDQIRRTGRVPSTELLACQVVDLPPEKVAAALELRPGDKAIYLYRKRCADGLPIVAVETYLPYKECAFITNHDFSKESLYNVLSQNIATKICKVTRAIEAVAAETRDADTLNIKRGKPIHFFTTIGFNSKDKPIEYSLARYRGDSNRFEVELYIETGAKN